MRRLFTITAAAAAGLSSMGPTSSVAQPVKAPLDALKECRAITDPTARLACFDKASDALIVATERRDVVVMDRAEVSKTRRSLFGFTLPKIALFGGGKDEVRDDVDQIDTTVASARQTAQGKWSFRTADGATWQTTDYTRDDPRSGQKVTIKRAALGSYFVRFGNGRLTRAMRVN